jgi:uncharacterized membrane protein YsdA (DUF1294 family)
MQEFFESTGLVLRNYWQSGLLVLIIWNALVYLIYADDKRRALKNEWRISEDNLLTAAFLGGAIGAISACMITRHKTRKKSFADQLFLIALIQALLFGGLIGLGIITPN